MSSEGGLDERNGSCSEHHRICLLGFGLQQPSDQFVHGNVLMYFVSFDMHVIEAATFGGTPSDSSHAL